jgi:hypothetical protein
MAIMVNLNIATCFNVVPVISYVSCLVGPSQKQQLQSVKLKKVVDITGRL